MSKILTIKKNSSKTTVNTKAASKPEEKKTSKGAGKGEKKQNLKSAIFEYITRTGVKDGKFLGTYEEALKLAQSIKPDTKFDKYHWSWYRGQFRLLNSKLFPATEK